MRNAGLYRGLLDLKSTLERWRSIGPDSESERADVAQLIQSQAAAVDLASSEPAWGVDAESHIASLARQILELEYTLIPYGLHVVGQAPSADGNAPTCCWPPPTPDTVLKLDRSVAEAVVAGTTPETALERAGQPSDDATVTALRDLATTDALMARDHEIPALLRALDGRFIRPAPGGDVLRTPAILPTGRNLHGFDPFRIPSTFAVADGARQAQRILDPPHGRRPAAARNPSPSCCGAPTI